MIINNIIHHSLNLHQLTMDSSSSTTTATTQTTTTTPLLKTFFTKKYTELLAQLVDEGQTIFVCPTVMMIWIFLQILLLNSFLCCGILHQVLSGVWIYFFQF